jgi:DNA-binding CsgD family transcriptional regulator
MLILLDDLVKKLHKCKTTRQADQLLMQFLLQNLQCKNFVYTGYTKDFRTSHQLAHQLFTPAVKAWHHYYVQHNFESIDPIAGVLRVQLTPFIWRNQDMLKTVAKHQRVIYEESIRHGFCNGISIPINGYQSDFAILVIHDNAIDDYLAAHPDVIYILQIAAIYYHDTIVKIMRFKIEKHLKEALTSREMECLTLSAQDLSAKEVAARLNITPRTVSFHIENANQKLNVNSKFQAITKAKELGII